MKEIGEILSRLANFKDGERAVLATVVDVRGSGYRLPGARMLILPNGEVSGMVSGGCLEADVLQRARKVLEKGNSEVFTYDTTKDESSVFSLNMGCRGIIRILIEPIDREHRLIELLRNVRSIRKCASLATLIAVDSPAGVAIGGRAFADCSSAIGFEGLPALLSRNATFSDEFKRFSCGESTYEFYILELSEGTFEFAFERLEAPISLLIFGAGSDAVPLAGIASELGWDVSVFDHRPAYLTAERFANASRLVPRGKDGQLSQFPTDIRTAAVMMTHNYDRDLEILPVLLNSQAFYVGALGPKRRTEQLLGQMAAAGIGFSEDILSRLYAPAGIDIGADSPEAIALSIIAEIQAVLRFRSGGHLRDRKGSIYGRN